MAETEAATVDAFDSLTATIMKAVGASDLASSAQRSPEEEQFDSLGGLPVPYPPENLLRVFERSSALRPCIDAITTNVHGFGHRWMPTIDLSTNEADKLIAESILAERVYDGEDDPTFPTDEEIAQRRSEVERGQRIEAIRMKTFVRSCGGEEGFAAIRAQVWDDYEITGNGYFEVARNPSTGLVSQLFYCPARSMRLRKLDAEPTRTTVKFKVGELAYGEVERDIHYRSYVQVVSGRHTYFKQFGDPRVMDRATGRYYASADDMPSGAQPATEIIHFRVHSGRSSYGIPRWIGAVFEVLGIRASSEVNYLVFDNKGIPPYMILVSGGSLRAGSAKQIEAMIQARVKGRQNYHAPLIIEADPPSGAMAPDAAGRIRIQAIPMTQPNDGTFLLYADQAEDVIARQWRISPITRGKVKDFNKSTADASMQKDEQQVFQPARRAFDERFNNTIVTSLGVRYVVMESNSPTASDPEQLVKLITGLVEKNIMTPEEARPFAGNALNKELPKVDADWAKQPVSLTLAGIPLQVDDGADGGASDVQQSASLVQRLVQVRNALKGQGGSAFEEAQAKARELEAHGDDVQPEVIRVPADQLESWVKRVPRANEARDEDEAA